MSAKPISDAMCLLAVNTDDYVSAASKKNSPLPQYPSNHYTLRVSILPRNMRGETIILFEALLWSLFPIVTILSLSTLTPLYSAGISTLGASLFFAILLTVRGKWSDLLQQRAWKSMLLTSFIIGGVFYGLMFTGLRYTTAGNGAILGLMEVFFSFFILGFFLRHDRVTARQVLGGACMVAGATLILLPKAGAWHVGGLLIVLATAIAPIGNKFAQDAREIVSAECIMFVRSLLSGLLLIMVAYFFETAPSRTALVSSMWFLAINSFLLLGLSKMLWIEAISRIPISIAISVESIYPAFTLVIAYFVLSEKVSPLQIFGLLPILGGIFLLTRRSTTAKKPLPLPIAPTA